ncbi:K+ channel tetramerization domain protein [Ancylostoma caninum]|uniref:K+ channel tetramerization domain protein n=1 Tax=Ancylostoma caninum TaxID=29170 RepID=A0A368GGT8_ANCCA|nr:K+ channel tetramerization domain protein [Ancylostoma caninum]
MSDIVVLNVGGKKFFTTVDTLTSAKPGEYTYFTFLDYSKGEIFIDRDPAVFNYTLNFLRESRVIIPADMFTRELILDDARFYGLKKFTRMLEWAMGLQGYQVIDVMDPICPRHYLAHDK